MSHGLKKSKGRKYFELNENKKTIKILGILLKHDGNL